MENERRNAAIAKFDAEHNSMVELKPVKALVSPFSCSFGLVVWLIGDCSLADFPARGDRHPIPEEDHQRQDISGGEAQRGGGQGGFCQVFSLTCLLGLIFSDLSLQAKDELSGLDQFLSMAQSIHSDICNIDKYALEAKDLDRQIQIYAAKVTDAGTPDPLFKSFSSPRFSLCHCMLSALIQLRFFTDHSASAEWIGGSAAWTVSRVSPAKCLDYAL